jgi:RNA polymerase sigma factor (sigma-70 family)
MMTDGELLRRYTETNSESAFAELVERHLALVYSAALRQVNGDAHLAQDVAQTVFADLARKAASLANRPVLTGWLYTSAHFAAAKAVRTEQRRHTREQEAHLMNQLLSYPAPDLDWEKLRPVLDAAMLELNDADREAVLLRYFNNYPHADIADRLGLSENAARMRVERALEKLHALLSSRGASTTAALSVVISANAVQLAPAGLAITVSTTAALAGTSLASAATATATKAIAMTTLQKTLITATIVVAVGTGIYEARQATNARAEVQLLQQQQAPLTEEIQQLQRERDETAHQLASLREDNERLQRDTGELLRLRGEVGMLRRQSDELRNLRDKDAKAKQAAQVATATNKSSAQQTVARILVTRIKQPQDVSEEQIRTNISIKLGDVFERPAVDRDVRSLHGTGVFSNLRVTDSISDEGVILNYLLQEKPKISSSRFAGNKQFPEADLAKLLFSKVDKSLDERTLSNDAQRIQELYVKSGLADAKVKLVWNVNEDVGVGDVVFEIAE